MPEEAKRLMWLAAGVFGDEGEKFRLQVKSSVQQSWRVGAEQPGQSDFASIYMDWARNGN